MKKAQIGFIGAGRFISANHLLTARNSKIMDIAAIADLDQSLLDKHAAAMKVGYTTTDYKRLLNDPDIDTNVGTLSGTFKMNIKPTEVIIRKPNGEIIEMPYGEGNSILADPVDESGKRYTTDSNNCWIKFTYNQ